MGAQERSTLQEITYKKYPKTNLTSKTNKKSQGLYTQLSFLHQLIDHKFTNVLSWDPLAPILKYTFETSCVSLKIAFFPFVLVCWINFVCIVSTIHCRTR